MPDTVRAEDTGERLESWKEIAAFLKRDVRTARRWEKLEGLPVHRHVHHKLATVYAFTTELDSWRAKREAAAAPAETTPAASAWRPVAVILGTLASVAVALIVVRGARPPVPALTPIAGQRIVGRLLAASTGEGQQPATVAGMPNPAGLAMSRDGADLYVPLRDRRTLEIMDTRTNRVRDSVSLPGSPSQLVLSSDGRAAYIGTEEGDVLQLDLQQRTLVTLARGLSPVSDLALTSDGARLYVTAIYNGLHLIDTHTRETRAIPTVRCPMNVAIVPGKDLAYVSYQCGGPGGRSGHDAVDVRVASSGAARATITGPPQVGGEIHASPDGGQIWIDGNDACTSPDYDHAGCPVVPGGVINVFRVDDNYLLGSVAIPGTTMSGGFSFVPDGSRAIVGGSTLKVIDTRSLGIAEEAPLPATGRAAFTPDGSRAYVLVPTESRLAMFSIAGGDRCLPPPAHLAAWWTGDGHPHDVREDNPGELRHGAAFAPAWVGQGFHLAGDGAYVHVTNMALGEQFSAAVWIKPAGTGRTETILDHGRATQTGWKLVRDADGAIGFCTLDAHARGCPPERTLRSRTTAPAGEWTHVVATAVAGRLSLFAQGQHSNTAAGSVQATADRQDFRIGGSFTEDNTFTGKLDEVQLFRQALTTSEVRRLFDAGRHGLCYR